MISGMSETSTSPEVTSVAASTEPSIFLRCLVACWIWWAILYRTVSISRHCSWAYFIDIQGRLSTPLLSDSTTPSNRTQLGYPLNDPPLRRWLREEVPIHFKVEFGVPSLIRNTFLGLSLLPSSMSFFKWWENKFLMMCLGLIGESMWPFRPICGGGKY